MLPALTKRQVEELEAVKAIFEEELSDDPCGSFHVIARFPIGDAENLIEVGLKLPPGYPKDSRPMYEIRSCPPVAGSSMDIINERISACLDELFTPGQEILFEWIESIKGVLSQLDAEAGQHPLGAGQSCVSQGGQPSEEAMSVERVAAPGSCGSESSVEDLNAWGRKGTWASSNSSKKGLKKKDDSSEEAEVIEIRSSISPLIMRKSVFIAHVARVTSKNQVESVMESILKDK